MTQTIHMCQSVDGPLHNWSKRDWQNATKWITREDGSRMTADELKREFIELLASGKRVSYITGCPGHDKKE